MMIIRVPFRVSFLGGGTDYVNWYKEHGGAVISTTFDKYCYISINKLHELFNVKYKISYSIVENCNYLKEIKHPLFKKILQKYKVKNIEIHYDADLPGGTGIGSSSSLSVGMVEGMALYNRLKVPKKDIAKEAINIERNLLNECVGSQDQIAACYGGFNHIKFYRNGDFQIQSLNRYKSFLKKLDNHLMLFFTGRTRIASNIAKSYIIKNKNCILKQMLHLVKDGLNSIERNDIKTFAEVLDESWQLKCQISTEIADSNIVNMYSKAKKLGALGGKLCGAGGGGFLLLLVEPDKQEHVRNGLRKYNEIYIKTENTGSKIIYDDGKTRK